MDTIQLPPQIAQLVRGKRHTQETTGMSRAQVWMYDDMVLKIQPCMPWTYREIVMLEWLHGRLPAPELIAHAVCDNVSYCLMTRVRGKMACDAQFLDDPEFLIRRLAEAFEMLWDVDISGCPVLRTPEQELEEARLQVAEGLVDLDNTEPETFGPGGFASPEALLVWLENNRPSFDPVFSHGDLCLPNLLLTHTGIGGFIDLGDAGVGDRWRDLALCCRSIRHNFDGSYGVVRPGIDPERLLDRLGIKPDREKLRWYLLLDELF